MVQKLIFCVVFQDLVEDFVFPASKLIAEARNGSGKNKKLPSSSRSDNSQKVVIKFCRFK